MTRPIYSFATSDEWRDEVARLVDVERVAQEVWKESPYRRSPIQPDNCGINYMLAVEARVAAECAMGDWIYNQIEVNAGNIHAGGAVVEWIALVPPSPDHGTFRNQKRKFFELGTRTEIDNSALRTMLVGWNYGPRKIALYQTKNRKTLNNGVKPGTSFFLHGDDIGGIGVKVL